MFIDNQNQEKKYSMVISSIGPTSNRDKSIIIIGIAPNMVSELEMACLANYILLNWKRPNMMGKGATVRKGK